MLKAFRIFFSLLFFCSLHADPYNPGNLKLRLRSHCALAMDAKTGDILYSKNPDLSHYPASLTKIATALVFLENCSDLDAPIKASQDALLCIPSSERQRGSASCYRLETASSHIGLKRGEFLSVRDLLYGLLLVSGNDAANLLAKEGGEGSISRFIELMNRKLLSIGCTQTHFLNPHGLHHPRHLTSARDLAIMTKEAMKLPLFRSIVSTKLYKRPKTEFQEAVWWKNFNRLLHPGPFEYSPAFGVKTGFTKDAKHNLVTYTKNKERELIIVLLKAPHRDSLFQDAIALSEALLKEKKVFHSLLPKGPQPWLFEINEKRLPSYSQEELIIPLLKSEIPQIRFDTHWKKLSLPIKKGEVLGHVEITHADRKYRVKLHASRSLRAPSRVYLKLISLLSLFFALALFLYRGSFREND